MTVPVYNSVSPVLPQGQEVVVTNTATKFNFYDCFVDATNIHQPTEWRVYADVNAFEVLIATGQGPINSKSRIQWVVEPDLPEGGGQDFILKAVNQGVGTITVPCTFCGFDYTENEPDNLTSVTVSVGPQWQDCAQLTALHQFYDASVLADSNSELEIALFARPGVGGVEVPIAVYKGKVNRITRLFAKITNTPGDLWTIKARTMDGSTC